MTDWKNPVAVAWYYRLKSREQRARNRAEGRCTECRVPIETRGVCEACKARRRERYHQIANARPAKDATLCLDCNRPCKVATSVRCQNCHCQRIARIKRLKGRTKGQAA